MLFHSFPFLLGFLPVTVCIYYLLSNHRCTRLALCWLVAASLFFYSFWNPIYLPLILGSICVNYFLTQWARNGGIGKKIMLTVGIFFNIGLLAYFKYADFFIANVNTVLSANITQPHIILPLAISFFTFQQIAYVVDVYKGKAQQTSFLHYCLFVTFFPQLIAGPIVHHSQMMPQFAKHIPFKAEHLSVGITMFSIGLFKKVVIADQMALFATPVFAAADAGGAISFLEAWGAALAYTMQLYFDFSGYMDMAAGAARMLGIRLPQNFAAPYRSRSMIDFWRRWHITLSNFLRDYIYIPLGGNRKGRTRQLTNLLITMLIGGLWHGAGWTFVVWGVLHGVYLVVNHVWRQCCKSFTWKRFQVFKFSSFVAWAVTFLCVVFAWVLFRAETFGGASSIIASMFGMNGIALPTQMEHASGFFRFTLQKELIIPLIDWVYGSVLLLITFTIVLAAPTTQTFLRLFKPATDYEATPQRVPAWKPNLTYAFVLGCITAVNIIFLLLSQKSEFLYFQF